MAWIAKLQKIENVDARVVAVVTYTDGVRSFNEDYVTSFAQDQNWLEKIVAQKINQLDSLDSIATDLSAKVDMTIIPEAVNPTKTSKESKKRAYEIKLGELKDR